LLFVFGVGGFTNSDRKKKSNPHQKPTNFKDSRNAN